MAKKKKADSYVLVIVESPSKAATINKYLGNEYKVSSSMGHLIDLPRSRLGVNIENNFEPEYITVRGKGKILNELKKLAKRSSSVLLASDNDREGEAIAYLIKNELEKNSPKISFKRIVFNEITKTAILEAIKMPRDIQIDKINAQRTRRVLDRIVGYYISPVLWAKIKNGLSAGRVQSVALRVICEREKEIEDFIPEEYWSLAALFDKKGKKFSTDLFKINDKNPELKSKKDVDILLNSLNKENFFVESIQEKPKSVKPTPPFITSKLQQTAASRFGFTSQKTMQVAQQLYEGINLGEERIGLITYMRTDSTRIADQALKEVRDYIKEKFPYDLPESLIIYSKSGSAQDAHEAIRPTSVFKAPDMVKEYLTLEQFKLYSIIWEKFVSSQMNNAEYLTKTILIKNDKALFKAATTSIINPGYINSLDKLKSLDVEKDKHVIPKLAQGEKLEFAEYEPGQHFTQPLPRYTDASIVKFLEENGIGRPSTYAPTISTLLHRYYVVRKARQLHPTMLGRLVNGTVVQQFPDIVDIEFTAKMEEQLDEIANGNMDGLSLLKKFYNPFKEKVDFATVNLVSQKKMFEEETDQVCEKCGQKMVKKLGRFGFFLACSGFPNCRNAKAIPLADCPIAGCSGKVIPKKKKKGGREFYGCSNYPECTFVSWDKPTDMKCPKCSKFLIEKTDKVHGTFKLCIDAECGYKQIHEN